ncbi:ATP-dependent helicase [Mycoplasmopsis synoviae]|uniref:ATP-dependent helicase n=1 Tax=Mycoplasmopsis synoviae TaxID=2109 RepID=UPI001CE03117|nr:UvrD-helicase domain-containing protein [Mycoplasmopsis synoviae]UBX98180.1 UvrD-helicase domain-containing protein [Mycoplasmopsis synoviae]
MIAFKKKDLLDDLNEKQREAVEYFDSHLRIIAGAGTGKTKVLTRKILYLILEKKVDPSKILAVTFTNKAAKEMKDRINSKYYDKQKVLFENVFTLHSFCAQVLRKYINLIGFSRNFPILDELDKKQVLQDLYVKNKITNHEVSYSNMAKYISWAKNNLLDQKDLIAELEKQFSGDAVSKTIANVYQDYLNYMAEKGALDFDDLILHCKTLLEMHPNVAAKIARHFNYILVDEFQDTSDLQFDILEKIIDKSSQLTIVGDPDQTIYNWRGASVDLILNFENIFENSKTIVLDTNYRSTKKILASANKLIKNNKNRFSKDLITNNDEGNDIEFYHAFNTEAEAQWVISKIKLLKKQKHQIKNIVILYRSNYYSRAFEDALLGEGINYKIFNGYKFYQRTEIKDVLAFLKTILNKDSIALKRIINVPVRGIGPKTVEKIEAFAEKNKISLYDALFTHFKELPLGKEIILKKIYPFIKILRKYQLISEKYPLPVITQKLLEELNYLEQIKGNQNENQNAIENVKELISVSMKNYFETNKEATAIDYLNQVSLLSTTGEDVEGDDFVSLMTIHASKGLEFDNVFIVGLTEGVFPNYKHLEDAKENKHKTKTELNKGIEEERRLAYVAITRARKNLFVSDSRGSVYAPIIHEKQTSRFIREMGIDFESFLVDKTSKFSHYLSEEENKNIKIIVGDAVSHTRFGEGIVQEVNDYDIVVKFVHESAPLTIKKNHPSIKVLAR